MTGYPHRGKRKPVSTKPSLLVTRALVLHGQWRSVQARHYVIQVINAVVPRP